MIKSLGFFIKHLRNIYLNRCIDSTIEKQIRELLNHMEESGIMFCAQPVAHGAATEKKKTKLNNRPRDSAVRSIVR